jgi:S-layer protein
MAYTIQQLVQAYTAVHDGVAPDAAATARLQYFINLQEHQPSDTQAMNYIVNSVDNTTALATLSYQFFTGKSPTKAGIDYLVNSPANPTDLNDAYYSGFNIENRYINFSANLGINGEGAAAFASKYGSLSFAAYVASVYETIIGSAYAKAAGVDPAAAIADIVGRQSAILATAQASGMITPGMTQAQIDIVLKAATAGYLLGEAIKADVGIYAAAANSFTVAVAQGTAVYGTDITKTYPVQPGQSGGAGQPLVGTVTLPTPPAPPTTVETTPGPVAQTLRLTAGSDTFTGGALGDTFNADDSDGVGGHVAVFTAGDVLNGGDGNDTLTIVTGLGAYTMPSATVSNIETANITGNSVVVADTTAWTGLTQLSITSVGGDAITAASTTNVSVTATSVATQNLVVSSGKDVTVNESGVTTGSLLVGNLTPITGAVVLNVNTAGAFVMGGISVIGGTTVNITQTASNAVNTSHTNGAVTITGQLTTTAVTIKAPVAVNANGGTAGIVASTVTIDDVNNASTTLAGTITSVDVDSYTTLTINDNALTTLKVAHGSGSITIGNGNLTTPTNLTLNLTINAVTGGQLRDDGVYTTLNATTGATASAIANIGAAALTTLNLSGASGLSLTSTAGMTALQTVTVTGAAGLKADLSTNGTVTSVNAAATSGAMTVTVNGNQATYAGGSGVDTVTLTGSATKAIGGGTGLTDVLSMTAAQAATASGSGTFAGLVTGFEQLILTGANSQVIHVDVLGGFHQVTTNAGNGLALYGMVSGDTLVLTGAGTAYTIDNTTFSGPSDSFNLKLADASNSGVGFASVGFTASGVETLNITVADTQPTPTGAFNDNVKIVGDNFKTITVGGNAGLSLTATSTALTNVDASGITLGGFSWTSGALAGAATVKGSATGANTVTFSAATGGLVTYTGGTGDDNITGANGLGNVVTLGAGNNSYVGGAGNETISVGSGANVISVGSGADHVILAAPNASATVFTEITGMTAGTNDTIVFTGVTPAGGFIGAAVGTLGTLALTLDAAAASTTAAGSPIVKWFVFGGDTYVVLDHSNNATFTAGVDYLVKLTGTTNLDLSTAGVTGSTLTLF